MEKTVFVDRHLIQPRAKRNVTRPSNSRQIKGMLNLGYFELVISETRHLLSLEYSIAHELQNSTFDECSVPNGGGRCFLTWSCIFMTPSILYSLTNSCANIQTHPRWLQCPGRHKWRTEIWFICSESSVCKFDPGSQFSCVTCLMDWLVSNVRQDRCWKSSNQHYKQN